MRAYFQASMARHAFWAVVIGLAASVFWMQSAREAAVRDWEDAVSMYEIRLREKTLCDRLRSEFSALEQRVRQQAGCSESDVSKLHGLIGMERRLQCEKPFRPRMNEVMQEARYAGCLSDDGTRFTEIWEPAPRDAFVMSRLKQGRETGVLWAVVAFGLSLLASAAGRLFFEEKNKGWQRIALLLSPVGAVVAGWLTPVLLELPYWPAGAVATAAGLLSAVGLVLGGRWLLLWVINGFSEARSQ